MSATPTTAITAIPQSPADVTALLAAILPKRRSSSNSSATVRDETGLRINGSVPNPFNTNSKEMRGAVQSLGLSSTNEGKDKAKNNPKKIEVRQRLNKVVNAVIDGFIGQRDDQLENITRLVQTLLLTDPKAASGLLQRLLPKQIDLNLDTSERIKSSIVLVDKSKTLNVQQVVQMPQQLQPQLQDDNLLTLDNLKQPQQLQPQLQKQEAHYYEGNRKNLAAGYPVDPPNLHLGALVNPPKDDSPEELARFAAELKEKGPKYQQMIELKKHFPEIKIPKFYVQNAKQGQHRKMMAAKRGRPKRGVPYDERAKVGAYRPAFDADVAKKAKKYAKKRKQMQAQSVNGDL